MIFILALISIYHSSRRNKYMPPINDHNSLEWRHNEDDGVSNHQPYDCLLNLNQAQIKENIKAPRNWPLWGDFTGDRWIRRTNGQLRGKCFHLMTSSCAINFDCTVIYSLKKWKSLQWNFISRHWRDRHVISKYSAKLILFLDTG